jgi:hypothetical protein
MAFKVKYSPRWGEIDIWFGSKKWLQILLGSPHDSSVSEINGYLREPINAGYNYKSWDSFFSKNNFDEKLQQSIIRCVFVRGTFLK